MGELLAAVDRTVGSFARRSHEAMKEEVEEALAEIGMRELEEKVKKGMTEDIHGGGDEEQGEFQDLGRSARAKKREEKIREKKGEDSEERREKFEDTFHTKWFGFLNS